MAKRGRSRISREIAAMRRSANALAKSIRRLAPRVRALEKEARASGRTNPRRRQRLSPKRRAALKLQGAYMGYMRQLNSKQKRQVKAVKEKKGFRAATAVAKRLVKG